MTTQLQFSLPDPPDEYTSLADARADLDVLGVELNTTVQAIVYAAAECIDRLPRGWDRQHLVERSEAAVEAYEAFQRAVEKLRAEMERRGGEVRPATPTSRMLDARR